MISTKKDGQLILRAEYRVLNILMKGDRWLIQKIQEIFDNLIGA